MTAYGKAEPLKPGMLLNADNLGEKRQPIEWVFEPLYRSRGRQEVADLHRSAERSPGVSRPYGTGVVPDYRRM